MPPAQDPAHRRRHGIYATPPALVGYLVRSVHRLLQSRFGWSAGLADPRVRLLDPAAGTLPFLRAAWRLALEASWHHGGDPRELLASHLLPHSLGVELLPEVHARGIAALRKLLARYGYPLAPEVPLSLLLGDSLDAVPVRDFPANVVLGNPPWRGRSEPAGEWITGLLADYFQVDGQPLGERNVKWLHDDAVRFLRLAQWKIEQAGEGIAALVLPHTGLDAPTFRGLRASLLASFEEIYALDLHGNHRKRETSPEGGADENVFPGVAQGVALLVLVKRPGLPRRVLRADLYGDRREKLAALAAAHTGNIGATAWTEVEAGAPAFLFADSDRWIEREFRRGLPLPEIFPRYSTGVISGCDALAIHRDRQRLEERIGALRKAPQPDHRLAPGIWEELRRDSKWRQRIRSILVRPFDSRFLLYADYFLARPRAAVLAPLARGANLALVACRQSRGDLGALVTRSLAGHKAASSFDSSSVFPLYTPPEPAGDPQALLPNLAPDLLAQLAQRYGAVPGAEEILAYVYAVLYDPGYRERYKSPLRSEFARIRFPRELARFRRLSALGQELIGLHLLTDERLLHPGVHFAGADPANPVRNRLGSGPRNLLVYAEGRRRLRVNPFDLRVEGVAPEALGYEIGGYPVLRRWLQARACQVLTEEDASHFCRVAVALSLTLEVQAKIADLGAAGAGPGDES